MRETTSGQGRINSLLETYAVPASPFGALERRTDRRAQFLDVVNRSDHDLDGVCIDIFSPKLFGNDTARCLYTRQLSLHEHVGEMGVVDQP